MHELVIIFAEYFIILSVLISVYVWFSLPTASDKKRFAVQAIVGGIIGLILLELGKHVFYNPRPFVVGHFVPYFPHGSDNGFPSEHALLVFYLAFLAWKYNRKAAYILFVLAVMVGSARVAAGIHHSIDIIGGAVFAAIAVVVSHKIFETNKIRRYFNKPVASE